jgi:hypothetical protein
MGTYYQNPESLPTNGRKLLGYEDFVWIQRQVRAGEKLVGCYDNGIRKVAPFLEDAPNYAHFEERYNQGMFLSRDFYAVKIEEENNDSTAASNTRDLDAR